jgi:gluconokinase
LTSGSNKIVVACSALTQSIRSELIPTGVHALIVHLIADPVTLRTRVQQRGDHFFPAALIPSQLAELEETECALTIQASGSPMQIVGTIRKELNL